MAHQSLGSDVLAELMRQVSRPDDIHRLLARSMARDDRAAGHRVKVSTTIIRRRQEATTEIMPD